MKIKNVAIAGFRAFKHVEDATFDFMINKTKVADFVSIYAPNGFGKTSFYDAVEWCVTGKIDRFSRSYIENEKHIKDENKINNSTESYFLANRYCTKKRQKICKGIIASREVKKRST